MAEKKNATPKLEKPAAIEICDSKTGEFKYLLDFTRDSVEWAEDSQKFNISELDNGIKGSAITKLFYYAFHAHHPEVRKSEAEQVLKDIGGMTPEMLERLVDLYVYTIKSIMATEDTLKNAKMTVKL